MAKRFVYITIVFLCALTIVAQEFRTEKSIEFRVGSAKVDPAFHGNAARISELVSYLKSVQADTTLSITNVTLRGSVSLEGSYQLNRKLADRRLAALEGIIRDNIDLPDSLISRNSEYIHWDVLRAWVVDSSTPYADEVLQIIDGPSELVRYSGTRLIDSRIQAIKGLHNGAAWNYIYANYFATMRNAGGIFVTVAERHPQPAPVIVVEPEPECVDTIIPEPIVADTVVADTLATEPEVELSAKERRPWYAAIKTNLLYDAAFVPNIGVDIYLGKNWSVDANWMYAWWKCDHDARYWRTYGGDIAVRKWFGSKANEKPLQGHHLGLYGQIVTYDFELGGRGYLGDRWSYAAGVEYGYSLPIVKHLNLDFTLGLGYLGGQYKEYLPIDGHYVWQSTKNRNWVGPTKLEVSLVWLIGYGNYNKPKPR